MPFRNKVVQRLVDFERMLGVNPFIMGEQFTVADAYAYTVISWSRHLDLPVPDTLQRYVDRLHERPSVQAARAAESNVSV